MLNQSIKRVLNYFCQRPLNIIAHRKDYLIMKFN